MKARWLTMAVCSLAVLTNSVAARQWNPDAHASAFDYSQISHVKPSGEIVLLWWVVPEIFTPNANNRSLLDVLSRYVVIGAAHGRPGANGALSFENLPMLQIMDQNARTFSPLPDNGLPPDVTQAIANLQGLSAGQLGPIAQGMRWFVYQADSIRSCSPGRLAVPLAGETYTYDTPIPGCVK